MELDQASDPQPEPITKVVDNGSGGGVPGSKLAPNEVNPNFGQPTAFQPPRQFRFGIRMTF